MPRPIFHHKPRWSVGQLFNFQFHRHKYASFKLTYLCIHKRSNYSGWLGATTVSAALLYMKLTSRPTNDEYESTTIAPCYHSPSHSKKCSAIPRTLCRPHTSSLSGSVRLIPNSLDVRSVGESLVLPRKIVCPQTALNKPDRYVWQITDSVCHGNTSNMREPITGSVFEEMVEMIRYKHLRLIRSSSKSHLPDPQKGNSIARATAGIRVFLRPHRFAIICTSSIHAQNFASAQSNLKTPCTVTKHTM